MYHCIIIFNMEKYFHRFILFLAYPYIAILSKMPWKAGEKPTKLKPHVCSLQ